jgi:hypothetical protein
VSGANPPVNKNCWIVFRTQGFGGESESHLPILRGVEGKGSNVVCVGVLFPLNQGQVGTQLARLEERLRFAVGWCQLGPVCFLGAPSLV